MNVLTKSIPSGPSNLPAARDATEIKSKSCVYSDGRLITDQTIEIPNCLVPRPDATAAEELLTSIGNDLREYHRLTCGQEFLAQKILWDVNKKIISLAKLLRNGAPNQQNTLIHLRSKISLLPQLQLDVKSVCNSKLLLSWEPVFSFLRFREGLSLRMKNTRQEGAPAITCTCIVHIGVHNRNSKLEKIDMLRLKLQLNELPAEIDNLQLEGVEEDTVYKAMYLFASRLNLQRSNGQSVQQAATRLLSAAEEYLLSDCTRSTKKRYEVYSRIKGTITVGAKQISYHQGNLIRTGFYRMNSTRY